MMIIQLKTIPDVAAGRRLYGQSAAMANLSAKDVARVMQLHHDQQFPTQTGRLAAHLRQIVCISLIEFDLNNNKVNVAHSSEINEAVLLDFLADNLSENQPLSTWNSQDFAGILHYRAFLQQRRLHLPHWQDLSADIGGNHADPLTSATELARLLDLPACPIWTDEQVWQAYLQDESALIAEACLHEVKMLAVLALYRQYQQANINQANYQTLRDLLSA